MRQHLTISMIALIAQALGGGSSDTPEAIASPELTSEMFAALDPTRAGRNACRGMDGTGALLDAPLMLARGLADGGAGTMPLLPGIGTSDLPLDAMAPEARAYFDQGLAFTFGFNHAAAIRSFRKAAEIDRTCTMCWWGVALASGPNINSGMSAEQNRSALAALAEAQRLSGDSSAVVRQLIAAQAARFSDRADADRGALNVAYAEAMLALSRAHPDSDDLAALAAESAMTTTPWNYWTPEGTAQPLVGDAVALLETVMARNPAQPQATHLYIHLLELPDPKRAEQAADMLREHAPEGLAHLIHMPAHIYHRLGRYKESMEANAAAVRAEEAYLQQVGDDGQVRYGYYPHNVHFLLSSAQMVGDLHTIVTQTEKLKSIIDVETGRDLYWVQSIYAAPYFAHAQYSSPDAVLALTREAHPLDYVNAMRHYARAVAYAQKREGEAFAGEIAAMEKMIASPAIAEMEANFFPAGTILKLAVEVAKGREAMARSRPEAAIAHFAKAAELQEAIPYSEPPFWYYPVKQSLGAAYYRAGRYEDAKAAFRAALFDAPNSALALYGLQQTERKLGNRLEAQAAAQALEAVWLGDDNWLSMGRL